MHSFTPDQWLEGIVHFSDPDHKFDLILIDVDNTIAVPETTDIPESIRAFLLELGRTHNCLFVSNSRSISSRASLLQQITSIQSFESKLRKPSPLLFDEILKEHGVSDPSRVAVIGDRLFTDVWFAKRNGATAILVFPFTAKEHIAIRCIRCVEGFLLRVQGIRPSKPSSNRSGI